MTSVMYFPPRVILSSTPDQIIYHPFSRLDRPFDTTKNDGNPWNSSEIESLRSALLLPVEDVLLALLEVLVGDLHPALPQREEARLRAHGLDVCPGELVLGHDVLLHADVVREGHLARVDVEDPPLGLLVGQRELDLAVDAARADQRRVQALDPVRRHDHLDVPLRVEAVELVEELEHGALDLALAARVPM